MLTKTKYLNLLIIIGVTIGLMSCQKSKPVVDNFNYDALYKTDYQEPFPSENNPDTTKASYGYLLMDQQGYNNWYYLVEKNGMYQEMTYSSKNKEWSSTNATIKNEYVTSTKGANATRQYLVQRTGNATIYGKISPINKLDTTATLQIFQNLQLIEEVSVQDIAKYFEIKVDVNVDDKIYFVLNGEKQISFNPTITFTNAQDQSLYHLTENNKCYGDVFPYYDEEEEKLYMGFIYSDDPRNGNGYIPALEISDNLLTFKDVPEANNYDIWQHYRTKYRLAQIFDCRKFIDSKYTFGLRDHFLYYEEENSRYLLIAGCYYKFDSAQQTSDLVIYESDDKFALGWTKPGNVVNAGYDRILPECPSLMKIGNRYYVFVSEAYKTAHQVGALEYWVGDANVDCMDVNWQQTQKLYLDGEDLCAARITQVKDRFYMWGWIPETYDTMPWSPWGGYLNLPREVIALSDGTLGTRLDEGLKKVLNYGNIYQNFQENVNNSEVFLTSGLNRNYITFNVDMKDSNKVSYIMKQGNYEYHISIVKENGEVYLEVTSPQDPKHKLNSRLKINSSSSVFECTIVNDKSFIEFFVNDQYGLTARTAMEGPFNDAYLSADGNATFTNISINKLVPYGDV